MKQYIIEFVQDREPAKFSAENNEEALKIMPELVKKWFSGRSVEVLVCYEDNDPEFNVIYRRK